MIVLKFGVRAIVSGQTHAIAEMRGAHHLYNALVAIERWRRREYAAIRSRYVPGLSEVEAAYEQLSDWIGEHAGPAGERGKIREKRRKATAATGIPTKQVDDDPERDLIAELKAWRKEAAAQAKPLRAAFAALTEAASVASVAYEARTRGVPVEWIEERNKLRDDASPAAREALRRLGERIEGASLKTHAKGAANARVREEMLSEPTWHDAWKDVARCDATAHDLRTWVGEAHHLNHGTYVAVGDDVRRAGKRPAARPDGEPRKPKARPAFSSKGLRKLGWQIQGGVSWAEVLDGKCRDLRVTNQRPIGGSGHLWRAEFAIRITTGERGVSEWVTCDVVIHRPIPADTKITWVYLVPDVHRGGKVDYSVQLTASPSQPLIQRAPGTGHAHIHFRWTQRDDTLDVADVNGMSVLQPPEIGRAIHYSESLRSAADKLFDAALAETVARGVAMAQWKSPERLHRVAWSLVEPIPDAHATWKRWRDERLAAKLDLFAPLEEMRAWCVARGVAGDPFAHWLGAWRRKDKHMREMERGVMVRAIRRRKDFYRVTAARLSEQYETVSFGGAVDVAALALRDKSEDRPKELHRAARSNRMIAAVAELREAIAYVFGERVCAAPPPGGARDSDDDAGSASSDAAAE